MKRNLFGRLFAKSFVIAAMAASVSSANALVVNFFNGSDLYATLTTSGGTDFALDFIGTGDSAAFVKQLNMLGDDGTFTNTTSSTIVSDVTGTFGNFTDQGDQYNWKILFTSSNSDNRLEEGETATWTISPTSNDIWDFNKIHINAFDGENSIKINGCVEGPDCDNPDPPVIIPEPATLALVGLAVAVAGLTSRRRRSA